MLTFLDVQRLTAEYSGRGGGCVGTPDARLFARRVMQYVQKKGAYGSIRRFHFKAQKGCITLPPELEVPLQVLVDGRVGTVWNQWMTFQSVTCDLEGGCPAGKALEVLPGPVFTAYPIPQPGSILGVLGTCEETDAFITVQGVDETGRVVVTNWRGQEIIGEKFTISKNQLNYGKVKFGRITGIVKDTTKGYVQLWAVEPQSQSSIFLGDYSPVEKTPGYTQAKVIGCNPTAIVDVIVQGRIRLKETYSDNDVVPFDDTNVLVFGAQSLQAEANNQIGVAAYKDGKVDKMIEEDAGYQRVSPGSPVNTFAPLSGGAIKGIVRYRI